MPVLFHCFGLDEFQCGVVIGIFGPENFVPVTKCFTEIMVTVTKIMVTDVLFKNLFPQLIKLVYSTTLPRVESNRINRPYAVTRLFN